MLDEIFTVGHSTRSFEDFVEVLESFAIERLVDIRRFPGSRRYPYFSGESLAAELPQRRVGYEHFPDLGGRRRSSPDSPNRGLRNESFRAYADYMQTDAFHDAVNRLLDSSQRTAIMCAEAVPWRCHRNLVSDELIRRGVSVRHLLAAGDARPHTLHAVARVEDGRVTYPEPVDQGKLFRP